MLHWFNFILCFGFGFVKYGFGIFWLAKLLQVGKILKLAKLIEKT